MQPDPPDAKSSKLLLDAFHACKAIIEFTKGVTLDEYSGNLLLRSAVERQFEILGEAFGRLDNVAPHYRDLCPNMGAIIGMRNRIIHGYDSVDDSIIWDAVQNHVPALLAWLQEQPLF